MSDFFKVKNSTLYLNFLQNAYVQFINLYLIVSYISIFFSFIQHLDFIIFHCSLIGAAHAFELILLRYIYAHMHLSLPWVYYLAFSAKKNDEKVIYLAKQLTMLLSLKSCETFNLQYMLKEGRMHASWRCIKKPTKNKTCVSSNVPKMSDRI